MLSPGNDVGGEISMRRLGAIACALSSASRSSALDVLVAKLLRGTKRDPRAKLAPTVYVFFAVSGMHVK